MDGDLAETIKLFKQFKVVGEAGLEPAKAYASGFTVRPLCRSGHSPDLEPRIRRMRGLPGYGERVGWCQPRRGSWSVGIAGGATGLDIGLAARDCRAEIVHAPPPPAFIRPTSTAPTALAARRPSASDGARRRSAAVRRRGDPLRVAHGESRTGKSRPPHSAPLCHRECGKAPRRGRGGATRPARGRTP